MKRSLLVAVILSMTVLAGCADQSASPTDQEEETLVDQELQATDETGVIRGVVVDPTVTPVMDATVRLQNLEIETTTAEDGSFGFSDLEPGAYFLEVSKQGFNPVQSSVEVEAGVDRPPVAKIQLEPNPATVPFVESHSFDGFIQCSWVAVAAALAMCSLGEPDVDLGDEFITFIDVDGYPDFVQSELVWHSTQPAGDALSLSVYDGTLTAPRESIGTSPQIIKGNLTFWRDGDGSAKSGTPMIQDGEQISFRVFAGGLDGTRGTLIWGVGVTIQQAFDIYTNVFYNLEPEEEWTFIEDGAYPVGDA